jgi:hypothetical protein
MKGAEGKAMLESRFVLVGDGNLSLDLCVEWRSLAAQDPEDGRRKEGDVEPDSCVGQVLKKERNMYT